MGDRREVIEALVEASSLGTEGARLLRARSSAFSVDVILKRVAQLTENAGESTGASQAAADPFIGGDAHHALPAAEAAYSFAGAGGHVQLCDSGPPGGGEVGIDGLEQRLRAAELANLAGDHQRAADLIRVAAETLGEEEPAGWAASIWERLGRCLWDAGAGEDALIAYARAVELVTPDRVSPIEARELLEDLSRLLRTQSAGDRQEALRSKLNKLLTPVELAGSRPGEGVGESLGDR